METMTDIPTPLCEPDTLIVPNVLICGVRRCGTTSLHEWLSDHPSVCASSSKGTSFLADRNSSRWKPESNYHDCGLAGYRQYFAHYRGQAVLLESTTRYLDQVTARTVLASLEPRPHVIFLLREPTERLFSSYCDKKNRLDWRVTFSQFVQCILENRVEDLLAGVSGANAAGGLERHIADLRHDVEYSQYVDYLLPWRESLGPDNVHVYLCEQMKLDARRFMQALAADIGIDPGFYEQYKFVDQNTTIERRSHWLHRVGRRLKLLVPKSRLTRPLVRLYRRLQRSSSPSGKTSDESVALARMRDHYRPYNERLAKEFSIDLSLWESR